jgi:hemoglobin-like flavoprotein
MNAEQIKLVQSSYKEFRPVADQAAEIFYDRLFEVAPEVKPLFKSNMNKQGTMLMSMMGIAVGNLDRLEIILPAIRALGQRHASYGVRNDHFAIVGETILWTLEQTFGPAFTPELKEAWAATYMTLAGVMKGAMQEISRPA